MGLSKEKNINILRILGSTVGNIIISYLIPILNIVIIYILKNNNNLSIYNCLNILLATNSCCIIGISSYLKINKSYNDLYSILKNLGLGICLVSFGISTFEIESNSLGMMPIWFYKISTIISFIVAFILLIIAKKEEFDVNKTLDEIEAQRIVSKSKSLKEENIDGDVFNF